MTDYGAMAAAAGYGEVETDGGHFAVGQRWTTVYLRYGQ